MVVMMIMMTAVVGQRADCYLGLGGLVACVCWLHGRCFSRRQRITSIESATQFGFN